MFVAPSSFAGSAPVSRLRALCVGRHGFLADHFARFFADARVDVSAVVGLDGALRRAQEWVPDVVVCEYDLLATLPLDAWEGDAVLGRVPILAVSLTRRPNEVNPLDANGIAGFLYLPTLDALDARRLLFAAAARPTYVPGTPGAPSGTVAPAPLA